MPETTTETVEQVKPPVTPAQSAPVVEPETGPDGQPFDAKRAQELIDKLREENKALKPKAKKADDLEAAEAKRKEAEMSELEKLQSQLKKQEEDLREANLREMRRIAADKAKLPQELVERLRGTTQDEMDADAAKLAAVIPKVANLNVTNPPPNDATITDAQRRAFLQGGPLPGA
jgi:uncharacterized phage infection (PIP) family protein YhgE